MTDYDQLYAVCCLFSYSVALGITWNLFWDNWRIIFGYLEYTLRITWLWYMTIFPILTVFLPACDWTSVSLSLIILNLCLVLLRYLEDKFEILSGYLPDTFGIPWGYLWCTLGILWGYLGDTLRKFWRYLGDTLGIPLKYF